MVVDCPLPRYRFQRLVFDARVGLIAEGYAVNMLVVIWPSIAVPKRVGCLAGCEVTARSDGGVGALSLIVQPLTGSPSSCLGFDHASFFIWIPFTKLVVGRFIPECARDGACTRVCLDSTM